MPRPSVVWLTRHAETSAPAIFHGAESNIGLSDLGRRQAAAAGDWFRPLRPTVIVSSAMIRAIDTAAPIVSACESLHHVEPDFHERRVGALSGTSFSISDGAWPETIRHWTAGNTAFTTPGAESFDEIRDRVLAAWNRTIDRFPGDRLLIVAHGVVCKVLLLSLLAGRTVRDWVDLGRVANLSVSELVPSGEGWEARQLLVVPPPVAALTDGAPTGVGPVIRSEA